MNTIELDGSQGEGGGQILRSALTLSMVTGTPFRIERIRARRKKPGLLRQHLTAVQAAACICGAKVEGDDLGSLNLRFTPGVLRGGDYDFAIGTAGSCTLVLQTVLPALWFADGPSTVTVSGGTHNPAAPPADFLICSWLPVMHKMGVATEIELLRHGFYPAGGGQVRATVRPIRALSPLVLEDRGDGPSTQASAIVAGVPVEVAKRELERAAAQLGPLKQEIRALSSREGPGNALLIELAYLHITAIFSCCGERGRPAETVADQVARQARHFRDGQAAADEHLADQLLLPLALAGQGRFTASGLSSHFYTNRQVIEKFLPVSFQIADDGEIARIALAS